jgi:hypothetical protein
MTDFCKDCYFNAKYSALCCIARSFFKKFYLRLRTMQLNVKFKSKIFLSTPHSAESRIPTMRHESGDPGVQFNEKTAGRKSREIVPLSELHVLRIFLFCVCVQNVQYTMAVDFRAFLRSVHNILSHLGCQAENLSAAVVYGD